MPSLLDNLTPTTLLLTLLALLLTYVFSLAIYNIYLHPLASIPGPFLAKFTEYYSILVFANNNRSAYQHTLLQRYGSPVRTSPNELVFADAKSTLDIYGQNSNPCLKDPFSYSAPTVTGARNVLNACHRVQHQNLRRLLAAEMAEKAILSREDIVTEKVDFFVHQTFTTRAEGESFEVYRGLNRLFIDVVTEFTFGASFDTMKGENARTADDITSFFNVVPAATALPWTRYLPVRKLREAWVDVGRLEGKRRRLVRGFVEGLGKKGQGEGERTFLTQLATVPDPNTGMVATEDELVENAIVFMVAGSGTTATTVTYVLYELGRREQTRKRLIDEIRRAFPDKSKVPNYEAAAKLPFLNCVVQETLRCRGPLTTSGMTRISPGRVLGSVYVPKGVSLYTDFYSLARDADTFEDPESWVPERWEHPTEAMQNMHRPWSLGPRNCIGRHLAEVGMWVAIARIYQLCDVIVDETKTTPDMMRLKDQGKITPWDESLTMKMVAKA